MDISPFGQFSAPPVDSAEAVRGLEERVLEQRLAGLVQLVARALHAHDVNVAARAARVQHLTLHFPTPRIERQEENSGGRGCFH